MHQEEGRGIQAGKGPGAGEGEGDCQGGARGGGGRTEAWKGLCSGGAPPTQGACCAQASWPWRTCPLAVLDEMTLEVPVRLSASPHG